MKLGVSGYRDFHDYEFVKRKLDEFLGPIGRPEVINVGDAKGVDSLVVQYCVERGIPFKIFVANWDSFGKGAGPKRNQKIIDESDSFIGFIHEKSKGTLDTLRRAEKKNIPTFAIMVGSVDENFFRMI